MALRVLLADSSETIKKVIQLTLQDFGLDLRIVNLGIDVLDVASQFKPDIIFVDILLQKKSGYEVSKELKTHPQLKNIPVVLMWSGFMEVDTLKTKESLCNAQLEKPFEAAQLRQLVQKLVPKTLTNTLAQHLELPDTPVEEKVEIHPNKMQSPLDELEKIQVESQKFAKQKPQIPSIDDIEQFEVQNIDGSEISVDEEETALFKINLPDDYSNEDVHVDIEDIEPVEDLSFLLDPKKKETPQVEPPKSIDAKPKVDSKPTSTVQIPIPELEAQMPTKELLEKMVQEKVQEIVEKMAWQIVPEIATQLIKKELDRLLNENHSPDA